MLKKIKKNQGFQWLLRGINYYLTIGVYGSLVIDTIIDYFDLLLTGTLESFYNFVVFFYPVEFGLVLSLIIPLLNFIFLDFKKSQLIFVSFILNTIAWIILILGLIIIYWASV